MVPGCLRCVYSAFAYGADHSIVHLKLDCVKEMSRDKAKLVKIYDYRPGNLANFFHYLQNVDWRVIYGLEDVNDKVEFFNNTLLDAIQELPYNVIRFSSQDKKWLTPVIKVLINKRWDA